MTLPQFAEIGIWIAAGLALGTIYLWLLGRSVSAIVSPGARLSAVVWLLLRIALAGAALWLAGQQGALPLLLVLLGFLIARTVAVRLMREAGHGG